MKKAVTLILSAVCVISILALSACDITLSGTETWDNSADDREGTVALFEEFFEDTFKNSNQVVTAKSADEEIFVETIDGASDYLVYTNGVKTYAFVDGNDYYYAMCSEDSNTYWVDETYYGYGYCVFRNYLGIFEALPDDEDLTYSCNVKGEGTLGENDKNTSTSTLTMEIKNGEAGSITITANAKNNLVESCTYTHTEEGETQIITFDFAYGSASVTIPDITDWEKQEAIG